MHRLLSKRKTAIEEARPSREPRQRTIVSSNGTPPRRPRRVLNEAAHKLQH